MVKTPNLDRLAAQGVRFAQHYAQCAPCGPSRASLHTGLYLHNHRSVFNGTPLDDRFPNLARVARAGGYDPTLFGYTDSSVDLRTVTDPGDPRLRTWEGVLPGFTSEVLLVDVAQPWVDWLLEAGYQIDDPAELAKPWPGAAGLGGTGHHWAPSRFAAEHTETAFLTGRLIDWIDSQGSPDGCDPWFAHASYIRPHPPFIVPEPYNTMYDPDDVPPMNRRETASEEAALHQLVALGLESGYGANHLSDKGLRQLRATYYGMISEVDDQMGRLLDWLDQSGHGANTLIVLTSDHGEQLGDHWMLGKLGFFDESYHIPLIIRDPSAQAAGGRVVESFTENVDIFPTICALTGLGPPAHLDGRSLASWVRGDTPDDWRTEVHWEFDFRAIVGDPAALGMNLEDCWLTVLRDEHGKYVHIPKLGSLFFDLDRHPDELVEVSGDPDETARVLDYAQRMISWRMQHSDNTLANIIIDKGSGPRHLAGAGSPIPGPTPV